MLKPGQSYSCEFTCQTPATGAAVNADSTPTAVASLAGTVDASFVLTVASTGTTGVYKITGTVPSGYTAGAMVQIVATAIVGGVTGRALVDSFVVDTKRVSDLNDLGGTAQTGDNFARIGTNGAGLTALGDTRLANLDALVSSRLAPGGTLARVTLVDTTTTNTDMRGTNGAMLAYTQPTGFLAATFPSTVGTSTYAGGDTTGTTTLLTRLTGPRAGLLDNLDAAVSSRMATFAVPASFSTADFTRLDATVSSRSTFAGGAVASVTAPVTLPTLPSVTLTAGQNIAANNLPTDYARNNVAPTWFSSGAAPTVVQIRQEIDANSTQLARLTGTLVAGQSVFSSGALVNVPSGGLTSGTIAKLNASVGIVTYTTPVPSDAPVIIVPAPSTDGNGCVVYAALGKGNNAPASARTLKFMPNPSGVVGGGRLITYDPIEVTTVTDGSFSVTLVTGVPYRVECPDLFNGPRYFTATGASMDITQLIKSPQ